MSDMATILVVDDDPIVRDVVVRYLERDGHRTLVAEDGDRADELLREEQLDLVVLDVMCSSISTDRIRSKRSWSSSALASAVRTRTFGRRSDSMNSRCRRELETARIREAG